MKRDLAINIVRDLPHEFRLEDALEKLVFAQKIEKDLKQIGRGQTISHEKVREIVKKW